jgi:PAS domain S-box-containing protein
MGIKIQSGEPETSANPRVEAPLARELEKFRVLYDLAVAMTADHSLDDNLSQLAAICRRLLGVEAAFIALRDEDRGAFCMHVSAGIRSTPMQELCIPCGHGLAGLVSRARRGRIVPNYAKLEGLDPDLKAAFAAEGLISGMGVPIQMGDRNLGVLYGFNRCRTDFDASQLDTLFLLGNLAAVEITRKRAENALQQSQESLEARVRARTAELRRINAQLRQEIEDRRQVEDALRQSEERFREMAGHVRGVFWLLDWEAQRMVYASPAYETIWRRPAAALLADYNEWARSIHPDDREAAEGWLARIAATRGAETCEYRIVRPDGAVRWIADRGAAIMAADGRVTRLTGIAEDITARKQAEGELVKRQKFLESILFHAPDAIVTLDAQHRVLEWNPGAESLFGYTFQEAVGRNLDDLVARADVYPEAAAITRLVLAGGKFEPLETVRYAKDGRPIPVIAAGTPIMVKGELQGVVAVYTDISARKEAETALRASEERLRAVYQTLPDPVTLTRLSDGTYSDVNQAFSQVTGFQREEVIGRTSLEIGIWQNPGDLKRMMAELRRSGQVLSTEIDFCAKDGRVLPGLVSGRPLVISDEPHLLLVTRDISELKAAFAEKERLEAQLKQAQKMEAIGTLAGGIAHDFNNLLMGVQGHTSLMMCDPEFPPRHRENLKGIDACILSAADLTRQLLGFARGGKYVVKPVDLNRLIAGCSRMFGRTHREINIQTNLREAVWSVAGDRSQIEQVLLNLFVNAWQAMPAGGTLEVATENRDLAEDVARPLGLAAGRYVRIAVADTGEGIDPVIQPRIFDPFFTTKERGRGTGLGLASVYGIVQNHGGAVTVFSRRGEGAVFHVYLPATEAAATEAPPPPEELHQGSGTILLVDDEPVILEVVTAMVRKLGYGVLTAESGQAALALYRAHRDEVTLVILDMIMPEMNGGETFDHLKAIDPAVRVLLCSGYSIDGRASEILARGCNGFIQKPFDMGQLSEKIQAAVAE